MIIALTAAFIAAFPVNRYLIDRGKGRARTLKFHAGHTDHTAHDAEPAGRGEHHVEHARPAHEAGADAGQRRPPPPLTTAGIGART